MTTLYQMRTYTLDSEASADAYEAVWTRHLSSLAKHKIHTYGVFRPVENRNQVMALVSYFPGEDPQAATAAYMASPEFRSDLEGFSGAMKSVDAVLMTPIPTSPMR